jgi:2-polyprenyl-3-methyl-5-hydroxy-6-metoxy-1,4-benzoquinol methylase
VLRRLWHWYCGQYLAEVLMKAHGTILDIGCGTGAVGRSLKQRGCGMVYGVEVVAQAAEAAKSIYDRVDAADVETFGFPYEKDFFDYVLCADVLEHLKDPWALLRRIRPLLKPSGTLIASIPNIRNRGIIADLLRGNWDYRDSGIMDNTHLRFFTFNGIVRMFVQSGYTLKDVAPVAAAEAEAMLDSWKQSGLQTRIRDMVKLLVNLDYEPTDDDLRDLFTLQFVVIAQRGAAV